MTDEERVRWDLEIEQIRQSVSESQVLVEKMRRETFLYPFAVGGGLVAATAAFVKLFT